MVFVLYSLATDQELGSMLVGRIEVAEAAVVTQWASKAVHIYWSGVCGTGQCGENQAWQKSGLALLDEQACSRTEVRRNSEDR